MMNVNFVIVFVMGNLLLTTLVDASSSLTPMIDIALDLTRGVSHYHSELGSSNIIPADDDDDNDDEHDENDGGATRVMRLDDNEDEENEGACSNIDFLRGRDPFVVASPPSVAAVCCDGVALVSVHHDVDLLEEDDDEWCNEYEGINDAEAMTLESSSAAENGGEISMTMDLVSRTDDNLGIDAKKWRSMSTRLSYFRDLPLTSRGPLRIASIHDDRLRIHLAPPMVLLTAGWRTDGLVLADAARTLMADEVRLFCPPSTTMASITAKRTASTLLYSLAIGRRIARGLSYYLTKCASGDGGGVRSLSCIGLLACAGRRGGSLHLIDATGAYRVRAHAIGSRSDALHQRMAYVDFSTMDCEEGLRTLLCLIAEVEEKKDGGDRGDSSSALTGGQSADRSIVAAEKIEGGVQGQQLELQERQKNVPPTTSGRKWNLPLKPGRNVVVELAVLRAVDGRMRRVRLSSLFPPAPLPTVAANES